MINYITDYSSIIIVTEKTGGGHEAVANALLEAFKLLLEKQKGARDIQKSMENASAEKYDVSSENVTNVLVEKYDGFSEAGITAQKMGDFYNYLLKHRPQWVKWYFRAINFTRIDKWKVFLMTATKVLDRVVNSKKPSVIISVYPLLQEALIVARKKGKLTELKEKLTEVKKELKNVKNREGQPDRAKLEEKLAAMKRILAAMKKSKTGILDKEDESKLDISLIGESKFDIPLITVLTDPFAPFWSAWSCGHMDCYFVPEAETKEEIARKPQSLLEKIFVRKSPVRKEKINTVTGMCVHPKFFAAKKEDPANIRKSLGLYPDKFTLFVNAGWNGNDSYFGMLKSLLDSDISEIQVVFLAGKNHALFDRASDLASEHERALMLSEKETPPPFEKGKLPTQILGFNTYMDKLIRASDLMISKTGAATTYEAFTCGLPIIVDATTCIMPQERGLAEYIARKKLGYLLANPTDISSMIKNCLTNEIIKNYLDYEGIIENNCPEGSYYSDWKQNTADIIKGDAAGAIAAQIHNYLINKYDKAVEDHCFYVDQSLLEASYFSNPEK